MRIRRELIFTAEDYVRLRTHLLSRAPAEEAAVLLAGASHTPTTVRLLVREIHPVPVDGFAHRGSLTLSVDPNWYASLLRRCREEGWSFVLAHSHPFGADASFSSIDDAGEQVLMPRLFQRAPDRPHGAIVIGTERGSARIWLPGEHAGVLCDEIAVRGAQFVSIRRRVSADQAEIDDRVERQVQALGVAGQAKLRDARIAIVGVGGVGSQIYVLLKHLGCRRLTLLDPDRVERSNLSRLVYARQRDVGRLKVEVAAQVGAEILPDSDDLAIAGDITTAAGAGSLLDSDLVVIATDNLRSRLVASRIMAQYLIPVIDTGIDIDAAEERIRAIGGRVTRLRPGAGCLSCIGILDPVKLSEEIAPRGYVQGADVPAPSVVSLNGVVAALAVNEILDYFTGYSDMDSVQPRSLVFDGRRQTVRAITERERACGVCELVRAAGDLEKLPVIPTARITAA